MYRSGLSLTVIISALSLACSAQKGTSATAYSQQQHTPFTAGYNIAALPYSAAYVPKPEARGTVAVSEVSGIAMSRKNKGMLWAHNDSGNPGYLFLIDAATGVVVARYEVKGTVNIDWEDIAVAAGPKKGKFYIYLSDTGDNKKSRSEYRIYRFEEPEFVPAHRNRLVTVTDIPVDSICFQYPGGPQNTESLLVDPSAKDIFFITKSGDSSMLYVLPYPQQTSRQDTAIKAGTFPFREASGAAVSPDGSRVIIRNRQDLFYWERKASETMLATLQRTPVKAPYAGEPQGEAVCFDDKNNYYTLSEQGDVPALPVLYFYRLVKQ